MLYQAELHCHTSEVSRCSRIPAKHLVEGYLAAGYKYMFVTDHYHPNVLESFTMRSKPWEQRIDHFLEGYYRALSYARGTGLKVLLGMEVSLHIDERSGIGNDFLVFGFDEEFLRQYPYLYNMDYDAFYEFLHKNGLLVFQAHPYRYGMHPVEPICYDGIEVINTNSHHLSHNAMAVRFALKNNIYLIGGSDTHSEEDIGRGGVLLPGGIETPADFVQYIRENGSPELVVTFGA
ncbi:MAG: PHP domain-containing protein [Christensenellaceae bacterium]|jgi:predicted metal-dependent phosphoesterase TrpH